MISGWYLDILVGYLIRILIRTVKARGCDQWPVEKALTTGSRCERAAYGGPVAEVTYAFHHEGEYCSGMHRETFLFVDSAEEYVARFREGGDAIVRVKPGTPEGSIVRQRDQAIGILT
jgi:hypothetical protein